MLGFFKDKIADIQAIASRYKDKESAEGIVAIMVGTAFADGEFEPQEIEKIKKAFTINPILKQFDQSVLVKKANELREQFEFDVGMGVDACGEERARRAPEVGGASGLRPLGCEAGGWDAGWDASRHGVGCRTAVREAAGLCAYGSRRK